MPLQPEICSYPSSHEEFRGLEVCYLFKVYNNPEDVVMGHLIVDFEGCVPVILNNSSTAAVIYHLIDKHGGCITINLKNSPKATIISHLIGDYEACIPVDLNNILLMLMKDDYLLSTLTAKELLLSNILRVVKWVRNMLSTVTA